MSGGNGYGKLGENGDSAAEFPTRWHRLADFFFSFFFFYSIFLGLGLKTEDDLCKRGLDRKSRRSLGDEEEKRRATQQRIIHANTLSLLQDQPIGRGERGTE